MGDLDLEWDDFLIDDEEESNTHNNGNSNYTPEYLSFDGTGNDDVIPKCSDIYISTKTKIAYLNQAIDLNTLFWKIKILFYHEVAEGIIKKQMKFICNDKTELVDLQGKLIGSSYLDELVLTSIENPDSERIKFKDVRKVSIGISKKDILSYRCKKKSAFYNCFVLIMRVLHNDHYHEIHIKVFNTGKLEIPGIKNNDIMVKVLDRLVEMFQPHVPTEIGWSPEIHTVLINSNFNCGFYINRARLFEVIQFKYKIASVYDPCSYPGIQCKFYYNLNLSNDEQTGQSPPELTDNFKKVSFMIFRTGSVLIVGKCDESELYAIYEFLKKLLRFEYAYIAENSDPIAVKVERPKKQRKRLITLKPT